jgi:hypothetical protein
LHDPICQFVKSLSFSLYGYRVKDDQYTSFNTAINPTKEEEKTERKKKQSLKPILKPIDRGRMIQMLLSSCCIAPSPIQTIFLIAQ